MPVRNVGRVVFSLAPHISPVFFFFFSVAVLAEDQTFFFIAGLPAKFFALFL